MLKSEQGLNPYSYKLIPRVLIFIFRDDEILFIKGSPKKRLWANQYNGIGGHIERGEDILSAARREAYEETGLDVSGLFLCGTIIIDVEESVGVGIYVFRGNYSGGELAISDEGTLEWFRKEDLAGLPLVRDLPLLIPRIISSGEGIPPFSAMYSYSADGNLKILFSN